MRIAHVAPRGELPWSGILTVVVHLSAALARRGHHVEVWQLHDWDSDSYTEQLKSLDHAGVRRFPMGVRGGWWRFAQVGQRAGEERDVDVVHVHSVFNPANTALVRRLRAPYVLSPHGGYDPVSLRRSRRRKQAFAALLERPMLRHAAAVCTLSSAEADELAAFAGVRAAAVIPNGVADPPSGLDRGRIRYELGVDPGRRLALYAGRLDVEHKGLDLLMQAVADAPAWHLALVGGDHRGGLPRLQHLAGDLGITSRVSFPGVRTGRRLWEALAGADVFALLSRWEGQPMALLEALAVGTPAIVSPAVERVVGVASAGAGWVSEPRDAGTLLGRIAAGGGEQVELRRRAARRLAAEHDWGAVARGYEEVYASVATSR